MLPYIITAVVSIIITALIVWFAAASYEKKSANSKIGNAEEKARGIIDEAVKTAEEKKRESMLEIKEESIKAKNDLDKEIKERRNEISRNERRIVQKEENVDKKLEAIEKREAGFAVKEEELKKQKIEISKLNEQRLQELERISGLTSEQAKEYLLKTIEEDVKLDTAKMIKEMENKAKEEANRKAKDYVVTAIQKCAADHVSETTISVVSLPNDEMKGRIIGREGRNIRTLETMTGVDLIIDDTPEAVILSSFDPIRREVARIALEKLIVDGRIHPARIEEMVEKAQKEVDNMIREEGEAATLEVGIHGIHPELVRLLGKMKFRTSYGQNAFFYDAAEGLLASVILLLAEFGDKNEHHIVSVFKLIQDLLAKYQPNPKAKPKMYFSKLMDKLPSEHKAKWLAGAALNASDQSMLSIMSTALSRLNSFLDSELEQMLCFGTAVDAEKFCNEKSAIFIVLPEEDTSKYFMVSLLIQQLYREILVIADENGGKLKNRVMFYCDEFGTFPKIEGAEAMFSAGRSRKISIVAIIQSFAQLEQNYGKQGMEIITDNTQLTVFGGFAPNSQSAEVLSKALGEQTVLSGSVSCGKEKSQSLQMIGRPLMTVDELKSMPKGQFIVMKTGTHPMISKLKLFFKWGIKFEEEYCLPDKTARQVCYKNRDELIRDVEVKYPQKKAVAAEIEVSVDDEEFDEFPMRKAKIKT